LHVQVPPELDVDRQIDEFLSISELAALVHRCESPAVCILQILERVAKLAVDIVDDSATFHHEQG
jgi:hypothetical protein